MKRRLIWKLLLINIVPVIGVIVLVIWLAIDQLAADYFMVLMDKYDVSPTETHEMFLAAIHRYLLAATLAALALALLLSYLLTRRVLRPLSQMADVTREVSAGNFSSRVAVSSQDEVGQLGLAFNHMADSLSRLEQLRKSMVADVAHELRTPLTNLRGYLEGLSDAVISPDRETFEMLQQEVMRLVNLVEDLQQLAKADAAKAFLNKQEIYLPDLIHQLLELYQPNFEEKEIYIETQFDNDAGRAMADRDKLLQAVRNLIENTWKYTPKGGNVTISVENPGQACRVSFVNSGKGIDSKDLPFIFERFYRGDRSRSQQGGGAGIGLAIVKELIEAHGGSVGAESVPDHTCIWFILPN